MHRLLGSFTLLTLLACGSDHVSPAATPVPAEEDAGSSPSPGTTPTEPQTVAVGVEVNGLTAGASVVLQNNGGDALTVSADGKQSFGTRLAVGAAYAVTVRTQPAGEVCTVAAGSGTAAAADVTIEIACVQTRFVDVTSGADTNDGSSARPWKTIAHAIDVAPVGPVTINIAPGSYGAGETFPLRPKANQTFVGDIPGKGAATTIVGSGTYAVEGGDAEGSTLATIVVSGVDGVKMSGLTFSTEGIAVLANAGMVDIDSATVASAPIGVAIVRGGTVTMTRSSVTARIPIIAADPSTAVRLRNTMIIGSNPAAIQFGQTTALAAAGLDLGTAADPGGNTFTSSVDVGVGLSVENATGIVNAVGNTWKPNVQGADADGHYSPQLLAGPIADAPGRNFVIKNASTSLQL